MASPPDIGPSETLNPAVAKARKIVLRHGWNAVAYQILNPGFKLWFSEDHDAVAGYVSCAGRWVIAGAPICDKADLPRVIEQLESAARSDGCRVCYFGAAIRLYEGCRHPPRHSVVLLGAQPVWNPAGWAQMIEKRASVRAQLHRATNKGVAAAECLSPSAAVQVEMQNLLDVWVSLRPMPPMHFLVEPKTLHTWQDRRVFLARQGEHLVGFLVASPIPTRQGWLVEQIIRHPTAPNGTNELLLNEAMLALARDGSRYVTLGLVPLARHGIAGAPLNPAWLSLLFTWVRAHGRRFYNFEGLEAFKAKFQPDGWEPIYAITTEPRFSVRSLWAIAAAFSHNRSPVIHGAWALGMALRAEATRLREVLRSLRDRAFCRRAPEVASLRS
jgi:phosphatidylglycerol lysyltransferase